MEGEPALLRSIRWFDGVAGGGRVVLASSVSEQSRDIGVRRALGASDRRIIRDVLMDATRVAIPGALAGVGGCVATSRFIGALLFEVRPLDPTILVAVVTTVLAVTAIACVNLKCAQVRPPPAGPLGRLPDPVRTITRDVPFQNGLLI
jgi:hypothetical protein